MCMGVCGVHRTNERKFLSYEAAECNTVLEYLLLLFLLFTEPMVSSPAYFQRHVHTNRQTFAGFCGLLFLDLKHR